MGDVVPKSLTFRDLAVVLKGPFRYVHLFLLHILLSKKNSENRHARPVTDGSKLRCKHPVTFTSHCKCLLSWVSFQKKSRGAAF